MKFAPVLTLAALAVSAQASATNYTLQDQNSRLLVSDRNGGFVWNVDQGDLDIDDAVDNLFMSNYFYRIGATGNESSFLAGFGAPTRVSFTGNALSLSFANASLAATLSWSLAGGTEGSGRSTVTKSATITNLGAAAIDLHLFDYSDYDINFDQFAQADQATLVGDGHIVTTSATVPFQIDAQATPGANHYEITDFYTLYTQLFFDLDGPTTLLDTPGPGTPYPTVPGDNAFAFQWDRSLGAGESFTVSQTARYMPTAVPEPAAWLSLILGFGLTGAALRRRPALAARPA